VTGIWGSGEEGIHIIRIWEKWLFTEAEIQAVMATGVIINLKRVTRAARYLSFLHLACRG